MTLGGGGGGGGWEPGPYIPNCYLVWFSARALGFTLSARLNFQVKAEEAEDAEADDMKEL